MVQKPFKWPMFWYNMIELKYNEEEIEYLLKMDLITKSSGSFIAPIESVLNPNGSL